MNRIALYKTTGRVLAWSTMATVLSTVLQSSAMAAQPSAAPLVLAAVLGADDAAASENSRDAVPDDRRSAAPLLRDARAAMERGDLQQAEAILKRVERAKISYPFVYWGDTPKKVRADLLKAQAKAGARAAAGSSDGSQSDDVFLRDSASGRQDAQPATTAAPPVATDFSPEQGSAPNGLSPPAENVPTSQATEHSDPARRASDAALVSARRALAMGDVERAREHLAAARQYGVQYQWNEDSPDQVDSAIARLEAVMADEQDTPAWRHQLALAFCQQAESLFLWNDFAEAERLATDAVRLGGQFQQDEADPGELLRRIAGARADGRPQKPGTEKLANLNAPVGGPTNPASFAVPALHNPAADPTSNVPASTELASPPGLEGISSSLMSQMHPPLETPPTEDELPLSTTGAASATPSPGSAAAPTASATDTPSNGAAPHDSLLQDTAEDQLVLARQWATDVANTQVEVRKIREREPRRALQMLEQMREKLSQASLDEALRAQLTRRIEISIGEMEKYISDNRAQIELDEQNRAVLDELDQRREKKLQNQADISKRVDEFNKLVEQQRFEEAEVVAKELRQIAPDDPIVGQIWVTATMMRRNYINKQLARDSESAWVRALDDVDQSAIQNVGDNPIALPDAKTWKDISGTRLEQMRDRDNQMSEQELEIRRKLKMKVPVNFTNAPLSKVVDDLQQLTGINIYLDPLGLQDVGVMSDTPITFNSVEDLSLKSVLNLILEQLHLTYVIKDEVLKITSKELSSGEIITKTYNVADLVIPIPNFTTSNIGLQAAIRAGHETAMSAQGGLGYALDGPIVGAASSAAQRAAAGIAGADGQTPPGVFANVPGAPPLNPLGPRNATVGGPGGMGGGAQADFDSLIELIQGTIEPETWEEVGGPGSIRPFQNNLSLVVGQTQDVHDQIRDLLEQLRRLQDLQVTIEVRFITLAEDFFERIGIDFDFDVKTGEFRTAAQLDAIENSPATVSPSTTVGFNGVTNTFTADLDIPFTQNSFSQSVPSFGGFDPASAAGFGFAILSDIEAFFVIQAAQGNDRTNILQAPKVTLFNGQTAFVSDSVTQPFVVSVIPVVGDFAAAQQPVIAVLSEGTSMTIQAVVSNDRRYVRMTVVPFFSEIGDVDTFTFEGTSTSTSGSSSTSIDDDTGTEDSQSEDKTEVHTGTTVQLPTFAFVTVTTTVSVPDGGTVLLGGIKRKREGRTEFGVPMLSKIPYVNRLFRNVGIGSETQSLMMMVTPRIIIQEEEEERLLGTGGQ